jgi:hypothetical protein
MPIDESISSGCHRIRAIRREGRAGDVGNNSSGRSTDRGAARRSLHRDAKCRRSWSELRRIRENEVGPFIDSLCLSLSLSLSV